MALSAGRKGVLPSELTPEGKIKNSGSPYVLPTASAETLGGVKVGSGLSIEDGVLSASGGTGGGFALEALDNTQHGGSSFSIVVDNLAQYDGIALSMDVDGSSGELQQLSFIMFPVKTGNVIYGFAMAAHISAGTESAAYFRCRNVSVYFATNTIAVDDVVKIDVTSSGVAIGKQTNIGYVKGIYGIKLS